MPEVTIQPGESETIINADDTHAGYRIRISGARVALSHTSFDRGDITGVSYPDGFSGTLSQTQGKPVYGKNEGSSPATVEVDDSTFAVDGVFSEQSTIAGSVNVEDSNDAIIDPATEGTLDELADATGSRANDHVLVQSDAPLDVSAATIDIQENTPLDVSAATVDIQENTPLDVSAATVDAAVTSDAARKIGKARLEDSGGTLVDPIDAADLGPFHERVTSNNTYATINPGRYGTAAIVADTSGSATLTVAVSNDGTNWSTYDVSIGGSEGVIETVEGFAHIRAKVDQNLASLDISAKGV